MKLLPEVQKIIIRVKGVNKMSNFNWDENIEIIVRSNDGTILDSTCFHNQITNDALNWLAKGLMLSTQDNEIKYLGWGSSDLALSTAHTTLSSETGRKLLTSQTSSNTGVCYSVCYIAPTEGVGSIKELAWFAGSSAVADSNTGKMISRVLYTRVKTALESITVTRKDTFTG